MKKRVLALSAASAFCTYAMVACSSSTAAENPGNPPKAPEGTTVVATFDEAVAPYIKKNCLSCHGGEQPADGKSFPAELTEAWAKENARLMKESAHEVENGKMPPSTSPFKPTPEESKAMIDWVKANIS